MTLPFRRPAQGASEATICTAPSPALRKWRVDVMLCSLSPVVREALAWWLLKPTDLNRWPPPDTFHHRRLPIQWEEVRDEPRSTASRLLYEELKVIRQTIDFPPEALSGLTSNGLLIAHGRRLRQLERWLWPNRAVKEIRRMIV